MAEDVQLGFAAPSVPSVRSAATPTQQVSVTPDQISGRVGTFGPDDLARGAAISAQIPSALRQLAGQPSTAADLVLALMLDADADVRIRQAAVAGAAAGELYEQVANLPELLRLPLIGIAMPAVVARPPQQVQGFVTLVDQLAQADGTYSLFEYCAVRLIGCYLRDALNPAGRSAPGRVDVGKVQQAGLMLLAAIAAAGNSDPSAAAHAFGAGASRLMPGVSLPAFNPPPSVFALDGVWQPLDGLEPRHKRALVEALVVAVSDDGVLTVAEAELLRTACALLHCPLPAMIA
jgi:hypothetical protein